MRSRGGPGITGRSSKFGHDGKQQFTLKQNFVAGALALPATTIFRSVTGIVELRFG